MDYLIIAAIAVGIWLLLRSRGDGAAARRNPELERHRWAAVRRVAEEDVTQLGQQIAATPVHPDLPDEGRQEFDDALASYERAKQALDAAAHPDDLQWVSKSIDDGRFALAKLEARRGGAPIPERRPPCFFDQRHGLSTGEKSWAPPGGAAREVPVCAACAARLEDGLDPQARLVETPSGQRPYYEGGPEYAPWAKGWYAYSGLHVMNSVMLGMLLMNSMYLPAGYDYGGDVGDGGGWDGGGSDAGGWDGGGGFDGGGFDGGF